MNKDFYKTWAKIIAKAWIDPSFKKKLLSNPTQVLKENGYNPPSTLRFHIHENTTDTIHLTLPEKPQQDLSEEELKKIAAGKCTGGCGGGGGGNCGANCY